MCTLNDYLVGFIFLNNNNNFHMEIYALTI
jgi:hypothetical protein